MYFIGHNAVNKSILRSIYTYTSFFYSIHNTSLFKSSFSRMIQRLKDKNVIIKLKWSLLEHWNNDNDDNKVVTVSLTGHSL